MVDAADSTVQIQLSAENVTETNGDVTITYEDAVDGAFYVVSVKYDTDTVEGNQRPSDRDVEYSFNTLVGGQLVQTDPGGITMAEKLNGKNKLVLDGEPLEDGHFADSE